MAKFVYIVLALCVVQGTFARVTRDAPAPAEPLSFDNFFNNLLEVGGKIQQAFADTQESVLKSLGFQSNDEVIQTIQKNTNQYVEKLQTVQTTIQEEVKKHSDVFEPIVKDLTAKIAETTAKLTEKNPELAQQAKDYQHSVETNLQSLFSEAQKTVDKLKEESRVPTEKLQGALKQIYDSTFETLSKTASELKPKN